VWHLETWFPATLTALVAGNAREKGGRPVSQELLVAAFGGLTALVSAIGVMMANLTRRKNTFDDEDEKRLADYDRWAPRILRYTADLRAQLAKLGRDTEEPPEIGAKEVTKS
jgi:hypothetical protein